MIPTFFGLSRYETGPQPGQAIQWWSLGMAPSPGFVRVRKDALSVASMTDDIVLAAGLREDALSHASLTSDLLES